MAIFSPKNFYINYRENIGVKIMGAKVNPLFVSSANNLKVAKDRLNFFKNNKNSNEYKNAEIIFHKAEKKFCSQPGLIEDKSSNALTKEQALNQVDMIMNEVHSWYA